MGATRMAAPSRATCVDPRVFRTTDRRLSLRRGRHFADDRAMGELLRNLCLDWPIGSLFEIAAIVGAMLVGVGLVGGRSLSRPTCRSCQGDLRWTPLDPPTCPHCGRSLVHPRRVRWGPRRIHRRLAVLGILLLAVGVGLRVVDSRRQRDRLEWSDVFPAFSTMREFNRAITVDGLAAVDRRTWDELTRRERLGRLFDFEREQIVRAVERERVDAIDWHPHVDAWQILAAIHVHGSASWRDRTFPLVTSASMRIAGAVDVAGLAANGRSESARGPRLAPPVTLGGDPSPHRASPGDTLVIHLAVNGPHEDATVHIAGPKRGRWWTIWRVDRITIDGRPLGMPMRVDSDGILNMIEARPDGTVSGGVFNNTVGRFSVKLPADLEPGLHEVLLEGAMAVVPAHLGRGLSDERCGLPPPIRWGERTRQRPLRLAGSVLVGESNPTVQSSQDEIPTPPPLASGGGP